jgi:membrane-associated phospholipid phosphatase
MYRSLPSSRINLSDREMATTFAVTAEVRTAPQSTMSLARRLVLGIGPLLMLYVFYSVIRYLVADRGPDLGLANAIAVLDLERRFGINWELDLQMASLPHIWFIRAANWYYVLGFLPMLVGGAMLAAWKAPSALFRWRGIFALSLLMAIVGYTLFPLTPPRLLPDNWGFIDTLQAFGPRYYGDTRGSSLFNAYGRLPSMVNVYAAMPSMHVAWSVIAGALIAASFDRRRWAVILFFLHPSLMALAVVVTANHYLLDVVAGLIVLALAIALDRVYRGYVNRSSVEFEPLANLRRAPSRGEQ